MELVASEEVPEAALSVWIPPCDAKTCVGDALRINADAKLPGKEESWYKDLARHTWGGYR